METCTLEDISYLTWSPLDQGLLSGKYLNMNRPDGSRMSSKFMATTDLKNMLAYRLEINDAVISAYLEVAKKHNLDICQMAIAFTIRREYMSCSIIGATNMDQLKNNIAAIDLHLSDEVLADIEKVRRKYPVPF